MNRGRMWMVAAVVALGCAAAVDNPLERLGLSPMSAYGGTRMTVEVERDLDEEALNNVEKVLRLRFSEHIAGVKATGPREFEVEVLGSSPADLEELTQTTTHRTFELAIRTVATDSEMSRLLMSESAAALATERGVEIAIDTWMHEESGRRLEVPYLKAKSRAPLERFVEEITKGPSISAPVLVAYEHVIEVPDEDYWRTYELIESPSVTHRDLDRAYVSYDQYINAPIIIVEFDDQGRRRFAELTEQNVGNKLAITLDDEVLSAPMVRQRITEGTSIITVGGNTPREQQNLAGTLVRKINMGSSAVPLHFTTIEAVPANVILAWAVRLALVFTVFAVFWLFAKVTRPAPALWLGESSQARGAPWAALLWSLLGPVVLAGGATFVTLPGLNEAELTDLLMGGAGATENVAAGRLAVSIFALGLMPVWSAAMFVEMIALLIPDWRARRTGSPQQRRPLRVATAALAFVLTAAQGYFIAVWLEGLGTSFGGDFVAAPSLQFRAIVIATLLGGTAVLLALAGIVEQRGLVGGFALLAVSPLVFALPLSLDIVSDTGLQELMGRRWLVIAIIAAITFMLCGRRHRTLRLPNTGAVPLLWTDAVAAIAALAMYDSLAAAMTELTVLSGSPTFLALALIPVSVLAGWLFTRAVRPARRDVACATSLSAVLLYGILALAWLSFDMQYAISGALLGAFLRDAVVEWRARRARSDWRAVWIGHQVQIAEQLLQSYIEDGTDVWVRGIHIRSLLHFFGPLLPMTIYLPADIAAVESPESATLAPAKITSASS